MFPAQDTPVSAGAQATRSAPRPPRSVFCALFCALSTLCVLCSLLLLCPQLGARCWVLGAERSELGAWRSVSVLCVCTRSPGPLIAVDARRRLGFGTHLHCHAALAQDCALSRLFPLLPRRRWGLNQRIPQEANVVERLLVPRGQLAQLPLFSLRAQQARAHSCESLLKQSLPVRVRGATGRR